MDISSKKNTSQPDLSDVIFAQNILQNINSPDQDFDLLYPLQQIKSS